MQRRLSGLDLGVLWGDLSIGVLVLFTGSLLVPALSLPSALAAIVIGSAIGCAALALVSVAGAREGEPTMVMLRPLLGHRGSYAPSVLNVLQLIGWTAVELWAMAKIANVVSVELLGLDLYPLWLMVAAVACAGLALAGPTRVIRVWLERFGVWVLAVAAGWLTVQVLSSGLVADAFAQPGEGGFPFWAAVDLVIVMPISWLPLSADYSRFAAPEARVGRGVFLGYFLGNVWFYALGAALVIAAGAGDVVGIGNAMYAVGGGLVVVLVLVIGETDEAFANIYSASVSVRNVFPAASQRAVILGVTVIGAVIALFLVDLATFESFLFLLGSVFVPLFAVFIASYFVRGERTVAPGVRWRAVVPWVMGFVVYHWCAPLAWDGWMRGVSTVLHDWLGLPFPLFGGQVGASIPGFAVAFVLALVVLPRAGQSEDAPSGSSSLHDSSASSSS